LTKAVGDHLLDDSVLNGEISILQHMTKDNYLDRYYIEAIGFGLLNDLIAGIMEQLCTKFPRMNIMEIGAGTGGATQAVLRRIDYAYSSYTYTDISSSFFDRAAGEKFQAHAHKMVFKTLDIEKEPSSQGFTPHSYDVIIASNVLHATKSLKETLEHTRSLLKPGGYLVMVEVIRTDVMRHGLVMGGLPGWWIGEQDGRYGGPSITIEQWDTVLRETGFAGIKTNSPMPDPVVVPGSVIVAQAQNNHFDLLRAPLKSKGEPGQGVLVIIGGKVPLISELRVQLGSMLKPYFENIIYFDHLDDVCAESDLPSGAQILGLVELETNLFEEMQEARWQRLKRVLSSAVNVLWLLKGSRSKNPYGGITLGLFRTLFYELPGTLLQTLDVGDDIGELSNIVVMLAELVVRLRTISLMVRTGELDKFLWSFEPELILRDNRLHITRLRPHVEQNARYNSEKRHINRLVDIDSTSLSLSVRGQSYVLRQKYELPLSSTGSTANFCKHATIRVSCSFLWSLKTPAGYVFVALGTDTKSREKTLCFSDSNSSMVTVPKSWAICLNKDESEIVDAQYMSFVVAELMAQQILAVVPSTGTVLAYEADPVVASLLSKKLADMKRKALFITSQPEDKLRRNWIYLHPHSTKRAIDAAIPADVTLYINASEAGISGTAKQSLGSRILASLSPICDKITLSNLVSQRASKLPENAPESITRLLSRVTSFASSMLNSVPDGAPLDMLPLKQVLLPTSPPSPSSLVEWRSDKAVPMSIEPVFERMDLFRPDRTYWLAGLSGDLGRSLADFIITHGAKHVVLSSRTPKIDEDWVQLHRTKGVTVKYFAW
jgi:SAM-dependent methyltransferase